MVKIKINDRFVLNKRLFFLFGIHMVSAIALLMVFDKDVMESSPVIVKGIFAYAVISTIMLHQGTYARAIVGYQILERLKDSNIPFYSLPFSNEYVVGSVVHWDAKTQLES